MFLKTFALYLLAQIIPLTVSAQKISWASEIIKISSEKLDPIRKTKEYKGVQVLGMPSVLSSFGESPCAWAPMKRKDKIKVGFEQPIRANKVIINQNLRAGFVVKVILTDTELNEIVVFERKKGQEINKGQTLNIDFELTSLPIQAVEVFFNKGKSENYYQIDAIGIAELDYEYFPTINFLHDAQATLFTIKLPQLTNSEYLEVAPCISPDGNVLFFTRAGHPENVGTQKKQDVWVSYKDEQGQFSKAQNLGAPINNESHNSLFSCNDELRLVLNNHYLPSKKMEPGASIAKFDKESNSWLYPESLVIEDFMNYNQYSEFFLSKNDSILLMTIESDEGFGRKDVHVSFKVGNHLYSKPLNLGQMINTASSEVAPFLSQNNRFLFFSSGGYIGFGSNDFFVSERLDDTWTNWSVPKNLGPWINTTEWDAYLSVTDDMKRIYFSSHRDKSSQADIYFTELPEEIIQLFR